MIAWRQILDGSQPLFAGFSSFWTLVVLVLPALLVLHITTVLIYFSTTSRGSVWAYLSDWRRASKPGRHDRLQENVAVYVCRNLFRASLGLSLCGVLGLILSRCTPGLYDDDGCADPILQFALPLLEPTSVYQYLWVCLSIAVLTIAATAIQRLDAPNCQARQIYHFLLEFFRASDARYAAVLYWKTQAKPRKRRRVLLFWMLLVVGLLFASLPAVLYILGNNMPIKHNIMVSLMRSSFIIAIFKKIFSDVLTPVLVNWLTKLRYPTQGLDQTPRILKTKVQADFRRMVNI